jgi:tryptophanyl-tRNA synthetase
MSLADPTKKMSKSLGPQHYVGLFEEEKSIREKIKRAVTDSEKEVRYDLKNKPAISNLLAIYSGIADTPIKKLEENLKDSSYVEFKSALADALIEHLRPIQTRYKELLNNPGEAAATFAAGAKKASEVAEKTMSLVREKVGLQ